MNVLEYQLYGFILKYMYAPISIIDKRFSYSCKALKVGRCKYCCQALTFFSFFVFWNYIFSVYVLFPLK